MARHTKIIGLLLAALYLSYFVGTHFFVHSHQAKQPHNHSTMEIQLIDELSNCVFLVDDLHPQLDAANVCFFEYPVLVTEAILPSSREGISLRAPPEPCA